VTREVRERVGCLAEALDLQPCKFGIRVGRRQVRHHTDDLTRERRQLGGSPPSHAGVELHVHGDTFGDVVGRDDERQPGVARERYFAARRRSQDQDA